MYIRNLHVLGIALMEVTIKLDGRLGLPFEVARQWIFDTPLGPLYTLLNAPSKKYKVTVPIDFSY